MNTYGREAKGRERNRIEHKENLSHNVVWTHPTSQGVLKRGRGGLQSCLKLQWFCGWGGNFILYINQSLDVDFLRVHDLRQGNSLAEVIPTEG